MIGMQAAMSFGGVPLKYRAVSHFNNAEVIKRVGKRRHTYLRWAGGYCRKIARSGIKRRGMARFGGRQYGFLVEVKKGPKRQSTREQWMAEAAQMPASTAGTPPNTHTNFLRDDIQFGFDFVNDTTVIGPYSVAWLNETHEYGGTLPKWVLKDRHGTELQSRVQEQPPRRFRKFVTAYHGQVVRRTARYPARSYMRPALDKTTPELPRFWQDSVKQ